MVRGSVGLFAEFKVARGGKKRFKQISTYGSVYGMTQRFGRKSSERENVFFDCH
jgi:hypothetical protein